MKSKVYYGEYTLQHWIDLMLSEDIVMPVYQRSFVWDEDMVKRMIANIKKGYFVPPVIIGQYHPEDGSPANYILDGQQRLTSLLLAQLGVYPDRAQFISQLKVMMDENDDPIEDDSYTAICDWTYRKMTEGRKSLEDIKSLLKSKKELYKEIDYGVGGNFFKEHFLGFCYLLPKATDMSQQQKYFSTLFRSINAQGVSLLAQESREALYFLDANKASFFKPEFIDTINIKSNKRVTHIDFARFLALLSNYKKEGNYNKVAVGLKKNFEPYYEEYIQSVVDDEDSIKFGKFSTIFPPEELSVRTETLKNCIEELKLKEKTYNSIILLDMDFMGLIYYVLFEGKNIDFTKKDELKKQLGMKTAKFKKDSGHAKNPSGMVHLRSRMKESLNVYHKFIV